MHYIYISNPIKVCPIKWGRIDKSMYLQPITIDISPRLNPSLSSCESKYRTTVRYLARSNVF